MANYKNQSISILEKLNKVLTEEGLNLDVAEFMRTIVIETKDIGENNSERDTGKTPANSDSCVSGNYLFAVKIIETIMESVFHNLTNIDESSSGENCIEMKAEDMKEGRNVDQISSAMASKESKYVISPNQNLVENCIAVDPADVKEERKIDHSSSLLATDDDKDVISKKQCRKEIQKIIKMKKSDSQSIDMVSNEAIKVKSEADVKDEREVVVIMEEVELSSSQMSEFEYNTKSDLKENIAENKCIQESNTSKDCTKTAPLKNNIDKRHLWVTNIASTTKAADLKKIFSKYGKVIGAKIMTDGNGCYGYISLACKEDAEKCLKNLYNYEINGIKIGIFENKPLRKIIKKKENNEIIKERPILRDKAENRLEERKKKEENFREKRELERLAIKKRKLDETERFLNEQRTKQRKTELRIREDQRQLIEDKEKLRFDREQFEKEKNEIMSLERERKRLERICSEKEKLEMEKLKKEVKKLKKDVERKDEIVKNLENLKNTSGYFKDGVDRRRLSPTLHNERKKQTSYDFCTDVKFSPYQEPSGAKGNDYSGKRKSSNLERDKTYFDIPSAEKLCKLLDCDRCSKGFKEEKLTSFGGTPKSARHSPWRQSSSGALRYGTPKTYQHSSKSGWGIDRSWKSPPPAVPTPPRIAWNSTGTSSYGGNASGRNDSSSPAIDCPSPPGVNFYGKYDGPGYSRYARKY